VKGRSDDGRLAQSLRVSLLRSSAAESRAMSGPPKMSEEERAKVIESLKAKRLAISEEGLKKISEHKYKPGVSTPIDNFFNTWWWNPLICIVPKSVAPNTVTVTGLVIQIMGFAAVMYYCPDFVATAPRWAYAFGGFTIFAYQTLDALDGKQARRTGSSSPLGQLMDHGCDSVVTIFVGMLSTASMHLGFSIRGVTFMFSMLLPFWMAQWTEYHAHTLPTNIMGLVGVTEAQLLSVVLVLSNVYDPDLLVRDLGIGSLPSWWCGAEPLGFNDKPCRVALNDLLVVAQVMIGIVGCCSCYGSVLAKAENKCAALIQTIPVWLLACVGYSWCIMVHHPHPRLVLFALGVSFSYMTCKMIVAAMSQTEYVVSNTILILLPTVFFISKFELLPRHDDVLLGAYTAVAMYSMARWVKHASEEISQYMGIHTFRLGARAKQQ